MSLKIDRVQLEIVIQQDSARQKLLQLDEDMRSVRKDLKGLKDGTEEWAAAQEKLKGLQSEYDKLFEKIGLNSLSVTELKKRQTELNAILNKLPGDSPLYNQYKQQLSEINLRMRELKGTANETHFSVSKLADGFNKYAAMGASVIATLTGVALTARNSVDDYAQLMEAESAVRKYAGMTQEQVGDLNEEFKKMDTRTARERLNELAGDAGKLGKESKNDVLEFVDAADKINVSLGDDLGKEAVKNIGKLAMMFGEDKSKGLRGAMLATGSAVNEIGQNSSAAEDYIVAFTARVAASGKQAKMSQTELMGYASVLDQNMQQEEMAGTAFQTLLMKMYQTPKKFAEIAGINVLQFTKMIKEDANGALLTFLDTLNRSGGLDKLAPIFKEMGLEGVRASGVINTLAENTGEIRRQQLLAAQAYEQGTSIIKEYDVQNNTVQAGLEKAKKNFKEISYELGEKLEPYMGKMITTGGTLVRMLYSLTTFTILHSKAIITTAAAIGTYTIAVQVNTIWQKKYAETSLATLAIEKLREFWSKAVTAATLLQIAATGYLTGATRVANLAMKEFFVTMGLNPIGIIIAGVVALTTAMYYLSQKTDNATFAKQNLNRVMDEAKEKTEEEKNRINALLHTIHSETAAYGEKQNAIARLKTIIPEYNAVLSKTGKVTDENTEAVNRYINALLRKNKIEGLKDELKDLYTDKFETEREVSDNRKDYDNKKSNEKKGIMTPTVGMSGSDVSNYFLSKSEKRLDTLNTKIQTVRKAFVDAFKEEEKNSKSNNKEDKSGGKGANDLGAKNKKGSGNPWDDDLKNAETGHKLELLELKKTAQEKNYTENEYQLASVESERKYLQNHLELIEKYRAKTKDKGQLAELNKMEADAKMQLLDLDKTSEKDRLAVLAEYRDRRLQQADETAQEEKLKLAKERAEGKGVEEVYNVKMQELDTLNAEQRLQILSDFADDVKEMEFKNGEDKAKVVKDANKAVIEADIKAATERGKNLQEQKTMVDSFKQKFGLTNDDDDTKTKLKALDIYYATELEKFKDNEEAKAQLKKLYQLAQEQINNEGSEKSLETEINAKSTFGINVTNERYKLELAQLDDFHKKGIIKEKDYEEAKRKLAEKTRAERLNNDKQYFEAVGSIASSFSTAFSDLQSAEETRVSAKYDKQISIAKKAGKDTTKLEEEKEEALHAVKKKYADLQFAAAVLQISSTTAVAAMNAYASLAVIPVVGPALGAAAAVAAIAAGTAQVAVAAANRDAAKGLKTGGYSDDYIEGFTSTGNPDEVAGAIPVHKNEFVANHDAVANPEVKQFLDVFNIAQKNGTIRMLNTTSILQHIKTKAGRYTGGYTDNETGYTGTGTTEVNNNNTSSNNNEILSLIRKCIEMLNIIADKDLSFPLTEVRKGIKKLDKMEQNAGW